MSKQINKAKRIKSNETTEYQNQLFTKIAAIFTSLELEWRAVRTGDKHNYGHRLDIAIGPFNDEDAPEHLTGRYNELVSEGFS
jgi:hypothetical protein